MSPKIFFLILSTLILSSLPYEEYALWLELDYHILKWNHQFVSECRTQQHQRCLERFDALGPLTTTSVIALTKLSGGAPPEPGSVVLGVYIPSIHGIALAEEIIRTKRWSTIKSIYFHELGHALLDLGHVDPDMYGTHLMNPVISVLYDEDDELLMSAMARMIYESKELER